MRADIWGIVKFYWWRYKVYQAAMHCRIPRLEGNLYNVGSWDSRLMVNSMRRDTELRSLYLSDFNFHRVFSWRMLNLLSTISSIFSFQLNVIKEASVLVVLIFLRQPVFAKKLFTWTRSTLNLCWFTSMACVHCSTVQMQFLFFLFLIDSLSMISVYPAGTHADRDKNDSDCR